MNQQEEFRTTETKGGRVNFTWGDKSFNLKGGLAYDDISRRITARDNSGAWQAATCGNNPSVFLLGPNGGAGLQWRDHPGRQRSGALSGLSAPATPRARPRRSLYQGSLIPPRRFRATSRPDPRASSRWTGTGSQNDSHYGQFVNTAPRRGLVEHRRQRRLHRGEGHRVSTPR